MKQLFEATLKAFTSLAMVAVSTIVLISLIGCGEQTQVEHERRWSQLGNLHYVWMGPNQIMVKDGTYEHIIHRYEEEGEVGNIEWEWEEDGDIDIEYAGVEYDVDSPWDYDDSEQFEGYEDIGGDMIAVWVGGKLVRKPKTWLASNPTYNKKYSRTKTSVKNGVVTTSKVTTSNKNGVAVAKVTKTSTDLKTGVKTTTTKTTSKVTTPTKKKTYKKASYKKSYSSSKKRRK